MALMKLYLFKKKKLPQTQDPEAKTRAFSPLNISKPLLLNDYKLSNIELGLNTVSQGNGGVGRKKSYWDAIVIGSGIGGLVAATQLAVKGTRVLALEKYVITRMMGILLMLGLL
ncbi:hypothetical protein Dsin_006930 [Dipteronia sinensis]|uniref:FAD-dependent oxidoreductase 2 FAD-binding domain-containing protein n=1 Tax=Dipteronia sinensis TaxID=43782 RepID=A0AAE0AZ56_9ROSI|nr:hypothetical protein Dsin_006930 [Dipteronia sinensis]